jgi:hypothetical protein
LLKDGCSKVQLFHLFSWKKIWAVPLVFVPFIKKSRASEVTQVVGYLPRKGEFKPQYCQEKKKSKPFPEATYIFPLMTGCPELCSWPPPAAREIEKADLTREAAKEKEYRDWLLSETANSICHRHQ